MELRRVFSAQEINSKVVLFSYSEANVDAGFSYLVSGIGKILLTLLLWSNLRSDLEAIAGRAAG